MYIWNQVKVDNFAKILSGTRPASICGGLWEHQLWKRQRVPLRLLPSSKGGCQLRGCPLDEILFWIQEVISPECIKTNFTQERWWRIISKKISRGIFILCAFQVVFLNKSEPDLEFEGRGQIISPQRAFWSLEWLFSGLLKREKTRVTYFQGTMLK